MRISVSITSLLLLLCIIGSSLARNHHHAIRQADRPDQPMHQRPPTSPHDRDRPLAEELKLFVLSTNPHAERTRMVLHVEHEDMHGIRHTENFPLGFVNSHTFVSKRVPNTVRTFISIHNNGDALRGCSTQSIMSTQNEYTPLPPFVHETYLFVETDLVRCQMLEPVTPVLIGDEYYTDEWDSSSSWSRVEDVSLFSLLSAFLLLLLLCCCMCNIQLCRVSRRLVRQRVSNEPVFTPMVPLPAFSTAQQPQQPHQSHQLHQLQPQHQHQHDQEPQPHQFIPQYPSIDV